MQYYDTSRIHQHKRFVDIAATALDGHSIIDFTHFHEVVDDRPNDTTPMDASP